MYTEIVPPSCAGIPGCVTVVGSSSTPVICQLLQERPVQLHGGVVWLVQVAVPQGSIPWSQPYATCWAEVWNSSLMIGAKASICVWLVLVCWPMPGLTAAAESGNPRTLVLCIGWTARNTNTPQRFQCIVNRSASLPQQPEPHQM